MIILFKYAAIIFTDGNSTTEHQEQQQKILKWKFIKMLVIANCVFFGFWLPLGILQITCFVFSYISVDSCIGKVEAYYKFFNWLAQ